MLTKVDYVSSLFLKVRGMRSILRGLLVGGLRI